MNLKRMVAILLPVLVVLFLLSGCSSANYTDAQAKEQVDLGRKLIDSYLRSEVPQYEITGIYMEKGAEDPNRFGSVDSYLSHIVCAHFRTGDAIHILYASTETGEIWTDLYLDIAEQRVRSLLEPFLKEYGLVNNCIQYKSGITFSVVSHDVPCKGETMDTCVAFGDVLPASIRPGADDALVDECLRQNGAGQVTVYFHDDRQGVFDPKLLWDFNERTGLNLLRASFYNVSLQDLQAVETTGTLTSSEKFTRSEQYSCSCAGAPGDNSPDPASCSCIYYRFRRSEQNGIGINYLDRYAKYSILTGEIIEEEDFPCPVERLGNTLHYRKCRLYYPYVYFTVPPAFSSVSVTPVKNGQAGQPAELYFIEYPNGFYSLGTQPDGVSAKGYEMMDDQILTFEP